MGICPGGAERSQEHKEEGCESHLWPHASSIYYVLFNIFYDVDITYKVGAEEKNPRIGKTGC